jgi:hypothetical protein
VPYVNVYNYNSLYNCLENYIINYSIHDIVDIGKQNREWMEQHWNPEILLKYRSELYYNLMDNNSMFDKNRIPEFNIHSGGINASNN